VVKFRKWFSRYYPERPADGQRAEA